MSSVEVRTHARAGLAGVPCEDPLVVSPAYRAGSKAVVDSKLHIDGRRLAESGAGRRDVSALPVAVVVYRFPRTNPVLTQPYPFANIRRRTDVNRSRILANSIRELAYPSRMPRESSRMRSRILANASRILANASRILANPRESSRILANSRMPRECLANARECSRMLANSSRICSRILAN